MESKHYILSHVIIHGGYHRGQIAILLRQAGSDPAVTDFIAYVRSRHLFRISC